MAEEEGTESGMEREKERDLNAPDRTKNMRIIKGRATDWTIQRASQISRLSRQMDVVQNRRVTSSLLGAAALT